MKRIPYALFLSDPTEAYGRYKNQFQDGIHNIRASMEKAKERSRRDQRRWQLAMNESKAIRKMVRELAWHEDGLKMEKGQEEEWLRRHLDSLKR